MEMEMKIRKQFPTRDESMFFLDNWSSLIINV